MTLLREHRRRIVGSFALALDSGPVPAAARAP